MSVHVHAHVHTCKDEDEKMIYTCMKVIYA